MTDKIEPWITETAAYIQAVYNLLPEAVPCITKIIANDIAAHAPQEPSVPVSALKLLKRRDVNRWSNWIASDDVDKLIRQAEEKK